MNKMSFEGKDETDINELKKQLVIARSEIKNLRQQLINLKHSTRNDVEEIQEALKNFKCHKCQLSSNPDGSVKESNQGKCVDKCDFPVIGTITSWFVEKRGVPRQSGLCSNTKGVISLNSLIVNNPNYALEGLEEFSHMWILFYFHKHDSNHIRAKVAPPRLNGARIGVFSTRSPHRPSPIGLSLVRIDKIVGTEIYFSGVDMLDGTPVLDIKPYIPLYDDPSYIERRTSLLELETDEREIIGAIDIVNDTKNCTSNSELEREVEGGMSDDEYTSNLLTARSQPLQDTGESSEKKTDVIGSPAEASSTDIDKPLYNKTTLKCEISREEALAEGREAPDGEEEACCSTMKKQTSAIVRVPDWISNPPTSKLNVLFNDRALLQLEQTENSDILKNTIVSVLKEDPRSVYLRKKLGNQFYTFLINDLHVSCKFDDSNNVVTVYQIKQAGTVCECGLQQWQCSIHSQ